MGETAIRRVALAGNPNSGKSSIFNALTGARQRVGNYPGVTVEQHVGAYVHDDARFEVLDLPGTYSLSSYSPEERVAQEELLSGMHDVVVVIVDSTTLRRSLVLLAQVMQIGANPVLCLNMADEAKHAGQVLDLRQMSELLGFPVVETVGNRGEGIDRLKAAVAAAIESPSSGARLVLGEELDQAIAAIRDRLEHTDVDPDVHAWAATKLLIGDPIPTAEGQPEPIGTEAAEEEAARQRSRIESLVRVDISLFVTQRYFAFVDGLLKEVMLGQARADARRTSDGVDAVLVHRVFGLPIFALVMYAIFWLTFTLGEPPMQWIEGGFDLAAGWISGLWEDGSQSMLRSLLVDGVIGGVGGVIVFLPNILLLFFGLALLEDTGYMARAAFLMDRVMHRFGLHGKSFLPMMTGLGCSIPGIMATRTLENERDRLTTMLVLPLMSCGARLTIWMLLIPAFFAPEWRAPMLFVIYATGIALAFSLSLLLRRSLLRGEEAPFVMELPPYRLPTAKAVMTKMVGRGSQYLRKAGTTILAISIVLWFLTAFPETTRHEIDAEIDEGRIVLVEDERGQEALQPPAEALEQVADGTSIPDGPELVTIAEVEQRRAAENLRNSFAGRIGRVLEPAVAPLGFDWRLGTAMIGAFAAKEVFVAQMGVVYSLGETDESSDSLRAAIRRDYSPLVGFSLMIFLLISAPCMATVAVTKKESGSWRWAFLQLGGLTGVAYLLSLIVYQLGKLLL